MNEPNIPPVQTAPIIKRGKGRPWGSFIHKDEQGNPIGVYEWRKKYKKDYNMQLQQYRRIKKENYNKLRAMFPDKSIDKIINFLIYFYNKNKAVPNE